MTTRESIELFAILIGISVFFFQAEDGIRDKLVTGVQTCALPIFPKGGAKRSSPLEQLVDAFRHVPHVVATPDTANLSKFPKAPTHWLGRLASLCPIEPYQH